MNRPYVWGVPSIVIGILALIVGLNALAGSAPGAAPAETGEQTLSVQLSELKIEPAKLTAQAGRDIKIDVKNAGTVQHNLYLVGHDRTPMLDPGRTATLEVGKLEAGTYELRCEVAGHADAGMKAVLTVEAAAGGSAAAMAPPSAPATMTADQMDASYMAGIKAYVSKTSAPRKPLQPTIVNGVKVFELTASEIDWEVAPGDVRKAMAYNGQVPGPEIRAKVGERVRILFHNHLSESSSIHFHGLEVPNDQDGVPGLTEDIVKAGADKTYEFNVPNAGTHIYHAHMDSQKQVPMGLLGPFIVEGPDEPHADVEYTLVLNDGPHGFTINGKAFPATEPIVAKPGQTIRIRYLNEGLQIHPMHLHGMHQTVIAEDGWPVPAPYNLDTIMVAPGQRFDTLVTARPGLWAFHCHILIHAESDTGYIGMTTVVIVK